MSKIAILVLEDGSTFVGTPFGAEDGAEGEVVFNTSMTGYQEVCSDPSYRGQMVVMTHPQIGNYGVSRGASESTRPWVAALIVRDYAPYHHHWQSEESLDQWLARHGVPGVQGIDTRAITRVLRNKGTMRAVLFQRNSQPEDVELEGMLDSVRGVRSLSEKDLVGEVSGAGAGADMLRVGHDGRGPHVVLLDVGVKHNIIRSLVRRGAKVTNLTHVASSSEIMALNPDGVLLCNGPGDPASLAQVVQTTRDLLETGTPLFGICLGHQILGLAIGATTSRIKFGHHGGNHPVKELATGKVNITSQNHEFQVDAASIPAEGGFFVSHVNLNDGSVEGLAHPSRPVFSVQYHPEGSPGPQDNQYLFDRFLEIIRQHKGS
ncbi:MAG TPA: glutamine-hydrolyzing carbamoyl-phosphate synthase small subunit [Chloroflexota bacterium]